MDFLTEANRMEEQTIAWRRDFHQHPELGFEETRTAGIVAEALQEYGLEVTTGVAETGVVGLLRGTRQSPVLLLRFDMDALPIQEDTGVEYASQNKGKMHACGHDTHVAVGLTVARLLSAQRDNLPGTIKFVFQPAEEGQGGARRMVEEGVLEDPRPDYSMAMHVWNEKPVGWYALTSGPSMAGAEVFSIRLTGKGGHGAAPHKSVDPIVAASQIVTALQTIASRNVSPLESAVVSVCTIQGGTAFNIIPQEVTLQGTIRTFKPEVFSTVKSRFFDLIEQTAGAMGCEADIDLQTITPPVINDPALTALMTDVVMLVHPDARIDGSHQTMGSEDFSYMMQEIPGCFVMVGSANPEKGLDHGHHHPKFNIDESCLSAAAAILAQGAMEILNKHPISA
jgi:amidohydrolase